MDILIVGGTGTIGAPVARSFRPDHRVITAGRRSGDERVDLADPESIQAMLDRIGPLDAIVCIAGEARWAPFDEMTESDFLVGIHSKLLGQVYLARFGKKSLRPGGSVTLTSGILADRPVPMTTSAAMVNGAIHSFVKAAALELAPDVRINAVSAGLVTSSVDRYGSYFPGHEPVPVSDVAAAYRRSVTGTQTGRIYRVYGATGIPTDADGWR